MFPDDSVQSIISPSLWWEETETKNLERGCLVYAFIPHVDQVPYTIKLVGRSQAERHDSAKLDIAPLRMKDRRTKEDLPVAAMALHDDELWTAYRAKKRPCLVLGSDFPAVNDKLRRGMPKKSTAPTVIVAPYYGSDQDGTRAGNSGDTILNY